MKASVIFTTFLLTTLLTGCAGMNGQFNCHRIDGKGVGCVSVDTVNQLAEQGAFQPASSLTAHHVGLTMTPYKTPDAGQPLRTSDVVQRVWIAPYQNKAGQYVGPTYVSMVIQSAHWLGFSPASIQSSNETAF